MNYMVLFKSVIYRIYTFILTFFIALFFTHDVNKALAIGLIDLFFKIFSYYYFDIIWDKLTRKSYKNTIIWLTGNSGAGKTTLANEVCSKLKKNGQNVMILDGDEIRDIFKNTGFERAARIQHIKDVGKMAVFLKKQGIIPIVSLISPYQEARDYVREISSEDFTEIYVSTPIEECEKRDVKGLYKKVRKGEIQDFTGISPNSPYEPPINPEITINTTNKSIEECVDVIMKFIRI